LALPGQIGFERDGLALDYRIQEIGEGMQGVEFSGLADRFQINVSTNFVAATLRLRHGLRGFEDFYPDQLSGGMKQRAALARALIQSADILLLDEPFGDLDAQTRESMQELLLAVQTALNPTMVFVTHDIEEAVFLSDRILVHV